MLSTTPLYWDPGQTGATTGGGGGTWSTTQTEWYNPSTGSDVAWGSGSSNGTSYQAIFGSTGGTVTLAAQMNVSSVSFNVTGYNVSGGSSGYSLYLGSSGQFNVASGTTATIAATISGGYFQMYGPGQLTLTGANTFSGPTFLFGGTFQLGGSATLGGTSSTLLAYGGTTDLNGTSQSLTTLQGGCTILNNNATASTLTITGNNSGTPFSGSIANGTGTVALAITGSGFLGLTGNNTFTGGTTISSGTLEMFSVYPGAPSSGTLGGASNPVTINGGTLDLHGTSEAIGSLGGTGGTIVNNYQGSTSILYVSGGSTTYAGVIADGTASSSHLALESNATNLTLTGANTYSGGTTIVGGTLTDGNSLGAASGSLYVASGTLDLHGHSMAVGSLTGSPGGTILNNYQGTSSLTIGGTSSYSGVLEDHTSGTGNLSLTSSGSLTLSGVDTYSGGTTILVGTITLSGTGTLGTAGSALTIMNGGTLDLHGTNQSIGVLNDSTPVGSIVDNLNGSQSTLTVTGGGLFDGTIGNGTGKVALVVSNVNLTLAGGNSFTGGTTLNSGGIQLGSIAYGSTVVYGSLGNPNGNALIINGGILDLHGGSLAVATLNGTGGVIANNLNGSNSSLSIINGSGSYSGVIEDHISGTGTVSLTIQAGLTLNGSDTYSGGTTLNSGLITLSGTGTLGIAGSALRMNGGTIDLHGTNQSISSLNDSAPIGSIINNLSGTQSTLTVTGGGFFSGTIGDGTGRVALIVSGSNLTLAGVNSFTGGTTLNSGGIQIGSIAYGSTVVNGTLGKPAFNSLTINGGTLDLHNSNQTVASLNGSGGSIVNNYNASTSTLNVSGGATTYSGLIADNTTGNGKVALTTTASANLTLPNSNTYSGGTNVSGGTLSVNNITGSATGSGAVTVNSGGTLDGNGTISGGLTVNSGGTLLPGTSINPGNLTVSSLSLQSGTNFDVALTNTGYSEVTVTSSSAGAVSLGSANLVLSSTRTESPEAQFVVINNTGGQTVSGTFSGLAEHAGLAAGSIDYLISYKDFEVQSNSVAIDDYRVQSAMELTATADMTGAINLAWLPTDLGETGYVIQRMPATGGSWTTLGTLAANSNYAASAMTYTFADSVNSSTPPAAGTAYQYQVLAYSGSTSNVMFTSNTCQATTVAAGVTAGAPVSITVPLQGSTVYSANLSAGVQYEVTASSYFQLASPFPVYADAGYDWVYNNPNPSTPSGSLSGQTLINYGIGINDATLDGNKYPYWGAYNPANSYSIVITGTGQPLAFNYHDDKYSDNAEIGGSTPPLALTIAPLSHVTQATAITDITAEPSDLIPYNDTGWKYMEYPTATPSFPQNWSTQNYNDSAFLTGQAGFGSTDYDDGNLLGPDERPTALDGSATAWDEPEQITYILLRHSFSLATLHSAVSAYFAVDNSFRVFVNGVDLTGQVETQNSTTPTYQEPNGNLISNFQSGDYVYHTRQAQLDSFFVNIPQADLQPGNNEIAIVAWNDDNPSPAFIDSRVSTVPAITYQVFATDSASLPVSYAITSNYPTGMMINSQTGLLTWSPAPGVTGSFPITVTASDGEGGTASTTFTISIGAYPIPAAIQGSVDSQNSSGVLTPIQGATVYIDGGDLGYESQWDKTIQTDSNGNYSLGNLYGSTIYTVRVNPPTGYVIASAAASFQNASLDANGDTVTLNPFILTPVPSGYVSPTINPIGISTAVEGHAYSQAVTVNGGLAPFTFSLDSNSLARGLSISSGGEITWTPAAVSAAALVGVTVTDSVGVSVSTTYSLQSVASVPPPSSVTLAPNPSHAFVNQLTTFTCSAQSEVGIGGYTLTATPINGTGGSAFNIPISSSGAGSYTFNNTGQYSLVLTATDTVGNSTSSSPFILTVSNFSTPTVTIETPTDGLSATDPSLTTTVTAELGDAYGLSSYSVIVTDLSAAGEGGSTVPAANQTIAVTGGATSDSVSYALDPTNLANGVYQVQISDTNLAGVSSEPASVYVLVNDRLKLGNLRLSFTDLTANVGGFPVTITRTYDLLESGNYGDFGYGWSLSDGQAQIVSTAQAQGNQALQEGDKIWLSVDDGQREEFIFNLTETGTDELTNLPVYTYAFSPVPGADFTDQLENTGTVYEGIDGNLYDNDAAAAGGTTDQPFSLALQDGTSENVDYELQTAQGMTETIQYNPGTSQASLVSVADAAGNELDYSASAITAYDPNHDVLGAVSIARGGDANAVTSISFGNTVITYNYADANGNHAEVLESVTDATGNTSTFSYGAGGAPAYYLTGITNAAGVVSLSARFDSTGRLSGLVDGDGNPVGLGTDSSPDSFGQTSETATDGLGYQTVTVYDGNGDAVRTVRQADLSGDYLITVDEYDSIFDLTAESKPFAFNGKLANALAAQVPGYGAANPNDPATATIPGDWEAVSSYTAQGYLSRSTDALGNTTLYSYNSDGQVTETTDALGHSTQNVYANGVATLSTDGDENQTSYTYSTSGPSEGELLSVAGPGGTTRYSYDGNHHLTQTIAPGGGTTAYGYDQNGNVTSTTINGETSYSYYDAEDRVTETIDPDGHETNTIYGSNGQVSETIDSILNTAGTAWIAQAPTSYDYDSAGHLLRTINSDGTETISVYDPDGRVILATDRFDPSSSTPIRATRTVYDGTGRVTSTQRLASVSIALTQNSNGTWSISSVSSSAGLTTTATGGYTTASGFTGWLSNNITAYNGDGTVASVTQEYQSSPGTADANEPGSYTTYSYDADGRATFTAEYAGTSSSGTELSAMTTAYDADGRQTMVTDGLGHHTSYQYDADGNLTLTTFDNGTAITDTYNAAGQKSSEKDQNGNTTDYEYDSGGNLDEVDQPVVSAGTPKTYYSYDTATGTETQQQDANGNVTSYTYDALGNQTTEILPSGSSNGTIHTYYGTFNGTDTRVTQTVDFDGNTTDYTYDSLGRVSEMVYYAYSSLNTPQETVTYLYNTLGQQTEVEDSLSAVGNTTYTYDANGHVTQVTSPQGTVNHTYDPATGQLIRTWTNDGALDESFAYDAVGRLSTVTVTKLNGTTVDQVTSYTYDLAGNLSTASTSTGSGTITATYSYDDLNRLTSLVNTSGSTTESSFSYQYDNDGNRTHVVEVGVDGAGVTRTINYGYDADNRLTSEADTVGSTTTTTTYTYDLAGNRLTETTTGSATITFSYDQRDHLTQSVQGSTTTTYDYDANGSTLDEKINGTTADTYTWDARNRMQSATVAASGITETYTYNDNGERVKVVDSSAGTTSYEFDDANPTGYPQVLAETNGSTTTAYAYGIQRISLTTGSTTHFYLYDGHGSVRQLTSSSGAITDHYTYDAFGNLISSSGSTFNVYRYIAMRLDLATGLYDDNARYLNTATGRYVLSDAQGYGQNEDPISEQKFLYADDDPIDDVDLNGHLASSQFAAIESAIQAKYSSSFSFLPKGILYGFPTGLGANPRLKPDIFDLNRLKWLEIKPLSPYGIASAALQYAAYTSNFSGLGYSPDTSWIPTPQPLQVAGYPIYVFNIGGILFYTDLDSRDLLEIPALLLFAASLKGAGDVAIQLEIARIQQLRLELISEQIDQQAADVGEEEVTDLDDTTAIATLDSEESGF